MTFQSNCFEVTLLLMISCVFDMSYCCSVAVLYACCFHWCAQKCKNSEFAEILKDCGNFFQQKQDHFYTKYEEINRTFPILEEDRMF